LKSENDPSPEARLELKATPETEDFRGKYESGRIGQHLLDRYFATVDELVERATITTADARVLEVGCGEGLSTMRLRRALPTSVRLEASEFVEHLIPRARQNNPGLEVTHESIYELTHGDGEFDLVFLLEVLEHLDHPDRGLSELKRVTRHDGHLVLGVPREPLWRVLNMARGQYWKAWGNTPGHLNHWSSGAVVRFVEEHYGPVLVKRTPLPWTIVLAKRDGFRHTT
jgi:2-polyprenyl-3-methyl-5-hydroxy-6-metoxy-1,4-benzoquinol methylase